MTKQQRGVVFQNLQEDIKEVFTATETTKYLKTIGEAWGLSEDEQRQLGEAVGLALMGVLTMKEFQHRLYEILPGEKQSINKVVKDIQRQIFQPIAGQLRKLDPQAILRAAERGEEGAGENEAAVDIPVPPPPGDGDAPGPSYGGASDPYREPPE